MHCRLNYVCTIRHGYRVMTLDKICLLVLITVLENSLKEYDINIELVRDVDKPVDNVVPLIRILEAEPVGIPDWAYEAKLSSLLTSERGFYRSRKKKIFLPQ